MFINDPKVSNLTLELLNERHETTDHCYPIVRTHFSSIKRINTNKQSATTHTVTFYRQRRKGIEDRNTDRPS